jgi:cell division protein FtsB
VPPSSDRLIMKKGLATTLLIIALTCSATTLVLTKFSALSSQISECEAALAAQKETEAELQAVIKRLLSDPRQ